MNAFDTVEPALDKTILLSPYVIVYSIKWENCVLVFRLKELSKIF